MTQITLEFCHKYNSVLTNSDLLMEKIFQNSEKHKFSTS